MLLSISLVISGGMFMFWICKKLSCPGLVGMILWGIMVGSLLDASLLNISADIRKIALVIILLRAGLSLDIEGLKKVGRPAVLMCFVPACLEMLGTVLIAPALFGISRIEAALMGSVLAAVSPAVVVPEMIKLMDEGYGTKEGIPQLILAGASCDDVFVIVMFSVFTDIISGDKFSPLTLVQVPVSIVSGIITGVVIGYIAALFFGKIKVISKVMIFFCAALALTAFEDMIPIPFSGLIGVMSMGVMLQLKNKISAEEMIPNYSKLWSIGEIFLFVLLGAAINIDYAVKAGFIALLFIWCILLFRMFGVFLCMLGTKLNVKERLFCMMSYIPKATVQAAIGGVPLAMGFGCGEIILTVAALSILLTAPAGAFLIEKFYKRLLKNSKQA